MAERSTDVCGHAERHVLGMYRWKALVWMAVTEPRQGSSHVMRIPT